MMTEEKMELFNKLTTQIDEVSSCIQKMIDADIWDENTIKLALAHIREVRRIINYIALKQFVK